MIGVLDLDSIAYSIGHPNKVLDDSGEPIKSDGKFVYYDKTTEELMSCADVLMMKILSDCSCDNYIAYIKGKGNYRYSINPDYKANRSKESPKWWQFVKRYLIDQWGAIPVNSMEVDDAVNITRLSIKDAFIIAIDKDLLSLKGRHYNWKTEKWVEVDEDQAEYNFWADMIVGQPGDNIKGLPGKGIKYVEKLNPVTLVSVFNEYIQYYGERTGINEFYKNYNCLKILEKYDGFVLPEPIKFESAREIRESGETNL